MANQKNNKKSTNQKKAANKNTNNNTKTNSKQNNNTKINSKVNKEETIKKEIKKEEVKNVVNEVKTTEKKSFTLTSKQRDIILILLVVVLLVVLTIVTSTKKEEKISIELPAVVEGVAGTKTISYTEYEELMESNKPFLMVIIQDGCGYCEMYAPVVEEVANELSIPVNYLNLTNLTSDENTSLNKSNSYLKRNSWGTPTTLFMVGNEVIDSIDQAVDKETFVDFVKENIKVDVNE